MLYYICIYVCYIKCNEWNNIILYSLHTYYNNIFYIILYDFKTNFLCINRETYDHNIISLLHLLVSIRKDKSDIMCAFYKTIILFSYIKVYFFSS